MKKGRKRVRFAFIYILITLLVTPFFSAYLDQLLSKRFNLNEISVGYIESFYSLITNQKQLTFFIILEVICLTFLFYIFTITSSGLEKSGTIKITEDIRIPMAVGQGQHGTARFLRDEEIEKVFNVIDENHVKTKENLGIVVGKIKKGLKNHILCVKNDINTILIGSTRSGKTRRIILASIWLRALTGKSMVITDVKGELFMYSCKFLKKMGYDVIDHDYREPLKSKRYNYMEKINKAIKEGDISRAIDYTWDLVSVLVGVPKGEPLWTNGESAVIAAAILIVAMEAPEDDYKNLTNVYYFLANMCKENIETGRMYISEYLETLPETHPAKAVFNVAEISPEKMRGSFFGMALTTLRLFTNWNIADLTSKSDFSLEDIGKKKTALFLIVHDEKNTFYPLISLLVNQIYVSLIETANKCGGRLPVEVDFICDEIGNFPAIPSFGTMLSAGLGRGIRFTLVIQDYQQLEKQYKEDFNNIKANCELHLFLKSNELKTLEEISKKTGTYTIQVNSQSASSSNNIYKNSYSQSTNLQSRALLTPDEVSRIKPPYALALLTGEHPAILYTPDLTEYNANKDFGLGDKEHNKKVYNQRNSERKERESSPPNLWGIWENYKSTNSEVPKRKISFLS